MSIIGFLASPHQVPAQNFAPAVDYYGVPHATIISIATADINGDGKLDIISANGISNSITVFTNNGDGAFSSNATYNVGVQPYCVAAADLRGSGKMDLISANFGSLGEGNTLTVLTNDGSGNFGSNATYTVGTGPFWVVAADLRGNGKMDLVSANNGYYAHSLTVLTNNGSGIFGSNATYSVGNGPRCVVAADVNGDGKLDLISANFSDSTVTVLTNNGNGGFKVSATVPAGVYPTFIAAADLNGDGKVDLVCANQYSFTNTLTVLTNNGSGVFGSNATLTVGIGPRCVVAADLRGSGKMDLVSADQTSRTLTVLTNNGIGVFGFCATLPLPFSIQPLSVLAADVNGDGKPDLVCANDFNAISVLMNVPMLTINYSSVSWPSSWTNWTLQQNLDLTTTNWSTSSGISDDGTNKSVIINSSTDNLFFRLSHP
jgi:hypothetical protein